MVSGDEPRARVLHSGRQLEQLRNRAVIATDRSFTISDPHRPDHPLVWVNPSFTRLTGYGVEEVIGRNCRFLQGPVTDAAGQVVNFVGVQTDVTERMLVEQERRLALATAEEVRNDLRLLTDATTWMTESLNVADAADRLTQSVVPALADYCCVDLLDEVSGRADRVAAYHRNPGQVAAL